MIRRLIIVAALAGGLTAASASPAGASPGACVAVPDVGSGVCVSNPAPSVPRPGVPSLP